MNQQLPKDMICFNQQCIDNHQQLYRSSDQMSNFHNQHQLRHQNMLIDFRMPHFSNISTTPISFSIKQSEFQSKMKEDYELLKRTLIRKLDDRFDQCRSDIEKLYSFDGNKLSFANYEGHFKQETKFTQLFLTIHNWFFQNGNNHFNEYLSTLPANIWKSQSSFVKQLIAETKSNACHQQFKVSIEEVKQVKLSNIFPIPIDDKLNKATNNINIAANIIQAIPTTQKLQTKPIVRTQLKQEKVEQLVPNKPKRFRRQKQKKDQRVVVMMFEVIKESHKLSFHYLPQKIKNLLNPEKRREVFDVYADRIFRDTFNGIQDNLIKNFHEGKMSKFHRSHKQRIVKEMKSFKSWMDTGEIEIFEKCIQYYNDINEMEIGEYELYVIYTKLVIKLIEMNKFKEKNMHYNDQPPNIRVEMSYLFFYYGNFSKLCLILKERYIHSQTVEKANLTRQFGNFILAVYRDIASNSSMELNQSFCELIKKGSYDGVIWNEAIYIIVQFSICKKLDQISKKKLIKKIKTLTNVENQSSKTEPIPISDQQQTDRKQRKRQLIHSTKVVKEENIEHQESQQDVSRMNGFE